MRMDSPDGSCTGSPRMHASTQTPSPHLGERAMVDEEESPPPGDLTAAVCRGQAHARERQRATRSSASPVVASMSPSPSPRQAPRSVHHSPPRPLSSSPPVGRSPNRGRRQQQAMAMQQSPLPRISEEPSPSAPSSDRTQKADVPVEAVSSYYISGSGDESDLEDEAMDSPMAAFSPHVPLSQPSRAQQQADEQARGRARQRRLQYDQERKHSPVQESGTYGDDERSQSDPQPSPKQQPPRQNVMLTIQEVTTTSIASEGLAVQPAECTVSEPATQVSDEQDEAGAEDQHYDSPIAADEEQRKHQQQRSASYYEEHSFEPTYLDPTNDNEQQEVEDEGDEQAGEEEQNDDGISFSQMTRIKHAMEVEEEFEPSQVNEAEEDTSEEKLPAKVHRVRTASAADIAANDQIEAELRDAEERASQATGTEEEDVMQLAQPEDEEDAAEGEEDDESSPKDESEAELEYYVSRILGHRVADGDGEYQYLCHWACDDPAATPGEAIPDSWESGSTMRGSEVLQAYQEQMVRTSSIAQLAEPPRKKARTEEKKIEAKEEVKPKAFSRPITPPPAASAKRRAPVVAPKAELKAEPTLSSASARKQRQYEEPVKQEEKKHETSCSVVLPPSNVPRLITMDSHGRLIIESLGADRSSGVVPSGRLVHAVDAMSDEDTSPVTPPRSGASKTTQVLTPVAEQKRTAGTKRAHAAVSRESSHASSLTIADLMANQSSSSHAHGRTPLALQSSSYTPKRQRTKSPVGAAWPLGRSQSTATDDQENSPHFGHRTESDLSLTVPMSHKLSINAFTDRTPEHAAVMSSRKRKA